jgi:hypothetical protein
MAGRLVAGTQRAEPRQFVGATRRGTRAAQREGAAGGPLAGSGPAILGMQATKASV